MLNGIPQEHVYSLEEVKEMDQNQKKMKKESIEIVKNNFQNVVQVQNRNPDQGGDELINYNLEALITMNHQDKQKRDRIGIMFKKAKE